MKIIKSFEDNEWARSVSADGFKSKANIQWGLGENGELYWLGNISGYGSGGYWIRLGKYLTLSISYKKFKDIDYKLNNIKDNIIEVTNIYE